MASDIEYVNFVCEQAAKAGTIRFKKMFGDYLVYCDNKPVLLICDNTVYIKILPEITEILGDAEQGYPYIGAKLHYVLDIDNKELVVLIVRKLAELLPLPKKKTTK